MADSSALALQLLQIAAQFSKASVLPLAQLVFDQEQPGRSSALALQLLQIAAQFSKASVLPLGQWDFKDSRVQKYRFFKHAVRLVMRWHWVSRSWPVRVRAQRGALVVLT